MALIVRFVWTARMFEMRFGASIWETYKAKEQCDPKRNQHDPGWPAQRAECAFGDDDAKQSIRGRTANETRLVAERRQQDESCDQRTDRRATRIQQSSDSSAVHPVRHLNLNASDNGRKHHPGQKRYREHQSQTEQWRSAAMKQD